MSNVFEFINADGLGDFGYQGNWIDETSPFVFGPPGPTDIALVETSGKITGSASVSTLLYYGYGGLLTSTVQINASALVLEGTVAISGYSYSNISDEVEEDGNSTVILNQASELYVNNTAGGTTFDVGVSSGYASTFNLTGLGTAVLMEEGNAVIGDAGIGAMTVSAGAELEANGGTGGQIILGNQTGSHGTLTVTGQNSDVYARNSIFVGYNGTGALSILAGAEVTTGEFIVGLDPNSTNTALISGAGSRLYGGNAQVAAGPNSRITIANGGFADFSTLQIGLYGNGVVLVEGAGSILEIDGYFKIGAPGVGSLQVTSGAEVVANTTSTIDVAIAPEESKISVSGVGSVFRSISGTMRLGWWGTAAVTISSGGKMITSTIGGPAVTLGNGVANPEETGQGLVTINGPGSNWNVTGEFDVGYNTHGTLLVEGGGGINTGNYDGVAGFVVGNTGGQPDFPAKAAGTATITGAGSTLTNNGEFVIGNYGSGTLNVSSAAAVHTTAGSSAYYGAIVGEYAGSTGVVSVTGNSQWTISTELIVGFFGSGSLTVGAGSTVSAAALVVSGVGSSLDVAGAGAKMAVSGNAIFGVVNQADVTIGSGGQLSIGGTAELEDSYLQLTGGALSVSKALTLDSGQLMIGYGTVRTSGLINSGTVDAIGGTLNFIGGVTGSGLLEIDPASTLSLGGSVSSGQDIIFETATSKLVLGAPASFAGNIYGFLKGNTIDLSKIIASSLTYSGQTLTVHESGGAVLALKFVGTYTQSSFGMTSDGHSGTFITHT